MNDPRYILVDHDRASVIRTLDPQTSGKGAKIAEATQQMLNGEMIFSTNKKYHPSTKTLIKRGLRSRSRRDDGGTYYWAEKA
ncbi:MAG: hypothetical protein DRR06_18790 [Gammaproteobacteria bacterium]|nr:MAG: hypothetical protein DRR06_18790 [Gammaproteobacteria bacterium]